MSIPHKCPVCEGTGEVVRNRPVEATAPMPQTCNACSGTGVVWEVQKAAFPWEWHYPYTSQPPTASDGYGPSHWWRSA